MKFKKSVLILFLVLCGFVLKATITLDPNGTSHLSWIFNSPDWTASGGSSLHIGDDAYADDWTKNDGYTAGQDAYAQAAGTVIYASSSPSGWSYGYQVVVRCSGNTSFAYRYAHLQSIASGITVGTVVSINTKLGKVGSSGTSSAHLHCVLYKNISSSDNSLSNLQLGKSPSGYITGATQPSIYAAMFFNDSGDRPPVSIVDDDDSGFSKYPAAYWYKRYIGYQSDMYFTYVNGNTVSNYALWKPKLKSAGNYLVEVYIPSNYATTKSAKYKVVANGVTYNYTVNQLSYSDKFVPLGTVYFNGSNNGTEYVKLTDATGEGPNTTTMVGFDAVRWTKQ